MIVQGLSALSRGFICRSGGAIRSYLCFLLLFWSLRCSSVEASLAEGSDSRLEQMVEARRAELLNKFNAKFPSGASQHKAACACYSLDHPFGQRHQLQTLCVCDNFCYDGSQFVAAGDPERTICADPVDAVEGGPAVPIRCGEEPLWSKAATAVGVEGLWLPVQHRSADWWAAKQPVWWPGMTYVAMLTQDTANAVHLLAKCMTLLLMNNVTLDTFKFSVDRIALPRHEGLLAKMRGGGTYGFHSVMLSTLIMEAVRAIYGLDALGGEAMAPHNVLGDVSMGFGLVEFENAFDEATEERPLCFERAVFPGILKNIAYVGGTKAQKFFVSRLKQYLQIKTHLATEKVRITYIIRSPEKNSGRRAFFPEAADSFLELLNSFDMEVRVVDFDGMTCRDQIQTVLDADIIISLHGQGLTSPATFGRPETIIIELMPFHTFHVLYYQKAVSTGMTYMMHQLRKGRAQEGDDNFPELSVELCEMDKNCKQYFYHTRRVDLTSSDIDDLRVLLEIAKTFVLAARNDVAKAGASLKATYSTLCVDTSTIMGCRHTFVHSPAADFGTECIVTRFCNGDPAKLRIAEQAFLDSLVAEHAKASNSLV
eukprot:TRINITY_DN8153_c0_g1_i2.p1 TRINITY_DN8153_c0_g1~~TRINITY_DN8153_c0_g1_i2.p1  ORF type:complete len:596 (-),score=69.10 TRINITY_DN8153_c0_g1_i2:192-1979(-)